MGSEPANPEQSGTKLAQAYYDRDSSLVQSHFIYLVTEKHLSTVDAIENGISNVKRLTYIDAWLSPLNYSATSYSQVLIWNGCFQNIPPLL